MRICLYTPELPPFHFGGIGQYVRDLAIEYWRLGHHVTIVGVGIHPAAKMQHDWGCSVSLSRPAEGTALSRGKLQLARSLCRVPFGWRLGLRLADQFRAAPPKVYAKIVAKHFRRCEGDYDVIETTNWLGHAALVRPKRAKFVVRLSTPAVDCDPAGGEFTSYEAACCRNADLVIGNSHAILDKTKPLYGLDYSRCTVIPHGMMDCPIHAAERRRDGLDLLYIGRCEDRKGIDVLLQALPQALAQHTSLTISFIGFEAGTVASRYPYLAGLWDDLQLRYPDRVRSYGKVTEEQKLARLAASHWVLIPSRYESFGLVAVEAIRSGTPFAAARVGGLAEVAESTPESVVVEPNDPETWLATLAKLAQWGAAGAESRRTACRNHYLQHYTSTRMAQASLAAYDRLLADRSAGSRGPKIGAAAAL